MGGFASAPHYRGPILRSAVAIVPFALIGALAMMVPLLQCLPGENGRCLAITAPNQQAPVEPATPTGLSAARPAAAAVQTANAASSPSVRSVEVVPITPAPEVPAPPTHEDLLAATFDIVSSLPRASAEPSGEAPLRTATSATDSEPLAQPAAGATEVATRVVTTTPVRLGYVSEPLQSFDAAPATAADAARQAGSGAVAAAAPEPRAGPAQQEEDTRLIQVGGDYLNVRAEASASSRRLFVLDPGERVEAIGRERRWIEIADADGRRGWVYADYMAAPAAALELAGPASRGASTLASAAAPAAAGNDASAMIVGGAGVNVRSAPSMSGSKLFALPAGERVTVGDRRRGWLEITDDQGRTGWSYSDFLYPAGNG